MLNNLMPESILELFRLTSSLTLNNDLTLMVDQDTTITLTHDPAQIIISKKLDHRTIQSETYALRKSTLIIKFKLIRLSIGGGQQYETDHRSDLYNTTGINAGHVKISAQEIPPGLISDLNEYYRWITRRTLSVR